MVKSPPENTQRLMPRLAYDDAPAAIEFLCRAFGFEETVTGSPVATPSRAASSGESSTSARGRWNASSGTRSTAGPEKSGR